MRYLIFVGLFLAGCASTSKYEARLKGEVGKSPTELVQDWGVPQSTMELSDGVKAYQYMHSTGSSGSVTRTYSSVDVDTVNYYCKTTFFIKDDKVTNWRWEGNACRSR